MTTQDQRLARPAGTGTSGMDGGLTLLTSARTRLHGVTRRHDEAGLHLQWVHALWWRHNGEEKVGTSGWEFGSRGKWDPRFFLELGKRHALVGWDW
jgi:hypothetical protein